MEAAVQPGFAQFLKLYAISVPVFFLSDFFWLGLIAKPFYISFVARSFPLATRVI
jgi:uncharacterized membrane protein